MATLKRTLGLPALTFYGIGIIVGAGIYSVIGAAIAESGESLWLSFLISAAIALVTSVSYAELVTMYPTAGAEYAFVRAALPKMPWGAFIIGVLLCFAGAAIAVTVALAFAEYLGLFVDLPRPLVAAAVLAVGTWISISGIKHASWVNIIFTSIEVLGLVLIIGAGAMQPRFGDALTKTPEPGIFTGAALIFFIYLGFEEIAKLAEEAKDSKRDLPRALFLSLGITSILYTLVALAVVALAPVEKLAESDSAIALAAGTVSPVLANALGWIALFATANTALITLVATSRILFAMARDGEMPAPLARLARKRQTPWMAALAVLGASLLMLPLGEIAVVASLASFTSLLAFGSVNMSLILLRYRQPKRERPFKVPFTIGRFPILPAFGGALVIVMMTQFEPLVYLISAGTILLGLLLYAAQRRRKK